MCEARRGTKERAKLNFEWLVEILWVKLDWVFALVSCDFKNGSSPSDSPVKIGSSPCDSLLKTGSTPKVIHCSWVCVCRVTNACVAVPLRLVGSSHNACCLSKLCSSSDDFLANVVTWLILPVVICLSLRLSHASLSISKLYSETADGSLKQLEFIWWSKPHGCLW